MDRSVRQPGLDNEALSSARYCADDALPNVAELVRLRAYELFCMRMAYGLAGDAASDWAQAEREIASAPFIALIDSEIEPSLGESRTEVDSASHEDADFEVGYEFFGPQRIGFERGTP